MSRPQTSSSANSSSFGKKDENLVGSMKSVPKDPRFVLQADRPPESESGPVSLPNYVEDGDKADRWGQSGWVIIIRYLVTQKPLNHFLIFRTPVKTAGDVSLSGKQLMPFLIKASFKLPEVINSTPHFLPHLSIDFPGESGRCSTETSPVDPVDRWRSGRGFVDITAEFCGWR